MLARMKHVVVIAIGFIAVTTLAYGAERNVPMTEKPISVNELAANPAVHSGRISVVGVVGTVNPGKGFVLVDSREFKNCGLSCLLEPGTNKMPFAWPGTAPEVKQTVQVYGILEKASKGFSIRAEQVTAQ